MRRNNTDLLKLPLLIVAAWLTILVLRLFPIGGQWIELKASTWLVFFTWVVVYFLTVLLGIFGGACNKSELSCYLVPWQNRWIQRLSLFSVIGAALIVYEFAVTRQYGFSTPVAMIRIMEVDTATAGFDGSWVSGIGRLLTPALMVAWVLATLGWSVLRRRTLIILLFASATVFYQQMMFEGGRFYLAALLVMIFFARIFVAQPSLKRRINIKKMVFWISLFIVVLVIFGYVFVARYQENERVFSEAYETWIGNFDVYINEEVYSRLSGDASSVWLAIFMLWAYVTQGPNELNSLLMHGQIDLAWGVGQFPQIAQGINKLIGINLAYDQLQNLPKVGTYTTLYGASYIDFGHGGALIFMGVVGWLTGRAIKILHSQCLNGLALNAPLLITLGLFAPIVSLVVNLWPAFFWALLVGSTVKLSFANKLSK